MDVLYVYMNSLILKFILFGICMSPCRIYLEKPYPITAFTCGLPWNQNLFKSSILHSSNNSKLTSMSLGSVTVQNITLRLREHRAYLEQSSYPCFCLQPFLSSSLFQLLNFCLTLDFAFFPGDFCFPSSGPICSLPY